MLINYLFGKIIFIPELITPHLNISLQTSALLEFIQIFREWSEKEVVEHSRNTLPA